MVNALRFMAWTLLCLFRGPVLLFFRVCQFAGFAYVAVFFVATFIPLSWIDPELAADAAAVGLQWWMFVLVNIVHVALSALVLYGFCRFPHLYDNAIFALTPEDRSITLFD